MKREIFFLVFLSLFLRLPSFAGSWSSGGGELIRDSANPWFIRADEDVRYCILLDEKNFGASADRARSNVKKAIDYWQRQFRYAIPPSFPDFGLLKVGSQRFVETQCDDDVSIAFQFGILNEAQFQYLKDPSRYAAVTVRTHYDENSLRAKGFIYVSPANGKLRNFDQSIVQNVWAVNDGHLLYLTLLHELGHVFGIQHMGAFGDLMHGSFVEMILSTNESARAREYSDPNFFDLRTNFPEICPAKNVLSLWRRFFDAREGESCFRFEFDHGNLPNVFGVSSLSIFSSSADASVSDRTSRLLAKIELHMHRFFPVFSNLIWLSPEQKVFSQRDLQQFIGSSLLGASGLSISKKGTFKTASGIDRVINVRFEQGKSALAVDGIIDGDLLNLL